MCSLTLAPGCGKGYVLCTLLCKPVPGEGVSQWSFSDETFSQFWHYSLFWHLYIDNFMLYWTGSNAELEMFMSALGQNEFNLKFMMQDPWYAVQSH